VIPDPALTAVLDVALFAAQVHRRQRDKGLEANPYVNHLLEVAQLLASAGAPLPVILAGLLHDTIEDSTDDVLRVDHALLADRFGAEIADLVLEVTDDKSLPKAARKARQVEHAPHVSIGAKAIKLADKTSNLRRLVHSPPGWSNERVAEYRDWAQAVVAGCRGSWPTLEAAFDAELEAARQAPARP